jgi:hypothetical protein
MLVTLAREKQLAADSAQMELAVTLRKLARLAQKQDRLAGRGDDGDLDGLWRLANRAAEAHTSYKSNSSVAAGLWKILGVEEQERRTSPSRP